MSIRSKIVACWALLIIPVLADSLLPAWSSKHIPSPLLFLGFLIFRFLIPFASRTFKSIAIIAIVAQVMIGALASSLITQQEHLAQTEHHGAIFPPVWNYILMTLGFLGGSALAGSLIWSDILMFKRQEVVA